MSSLYKIEVTDKPDEQSFVVRIKVVHPDAMKIPATPGFALMLLNDNANDTPLRTIVDLETVMDEDWVAENAHGIVDTVEVLEEKYPVPRDAERNYDHPFWDNTAEWPEALLKIHCTHPAWCGHIHGGDGWESAAFNPSRNYDESEPILPEEVDHGVSLESAVEYSEGFIPVPKMFLFNGVSPAKLDDIVYIPSYNNPSYSIENRMEGKDAGSFSFDAWRGKPVAWSCYGCADTGILADVSDDGALRLMSIKGSSRSENNVDCGGLEWIGTLSFKKGKKKGRKELGVSDVVYFFDGAVMSVKKNGSRLRLGIMNCSRYENELRMNPARALAIIALPVSLCHRFETESPLGAALEEIMAKKEVGDMSEIYQHAADRFIRSYTLTACGKKADGIDDLSNDELLGFYKVYAWPCDTLDIELTDEKWGAHLDEKIPFCYQLYISDDKYDE